MKNIIVLVFLSFFLQSTAFANMTTEAVVVGVGTSKQLALKSAFNNAVDLLRETYVGVVDQIDNHDLREITGVSVANVKQYRILDQTEENGLVTLTVNVMLEKQDAIKDELDINIKHNSVVDNSLDIATFQQALMKKSMLLLRVMSDESTILSSGYQFRAAGAPVVEEVSAEHISGYLPLWVGRNTLFWLELFDVLKSVEPTHSKSSFSLYTSSVENILWSTLGQEIPEYSADNYQLRPSSSPSVKMTSDVAGLLKPLFLKISFKGSPCSLNMVLNRNAIGVGLDHEVFDTSFPFSYVLRPEVSSFGQVLTFPKGTPIYTLPGTTDESAFTTGLGFVVKLPFDFERAQDFKLSLNKILIDTGRSVHEISLDHY